MIRHWMFASILTLAGPAMGQAITMEGDYSMLTRLSIFSRQRVITPAVTSSADSRTERTIPVKPPVFVGAMKVDTGMVAMVQVFAADGRSECITVEPGETIHWGTNSSKVVEITMNEIWLSGANGRHEEVAMGSDLLNRPQENVYAVRPGLLGRDAAFVARSENEPPSGRAGRFTAQREPQFFRSRGTSDEVGSDAQAAADPPLPPGSSDNIEARMRARRAAQLEAVN